MGKIDGTRYPERLTAQDAVEVADVVVNELDGNPPSKEVLADALGHSTASSGAYITKVADARNYGILPSRGIEATNLAQRVANPRDREERREAIFEMYQNIPILADLHDHLDGRDAPNQLWSVLVDITDIERNEAKEVEDSIRRLYEDMLRFSPDGSSDSELEQSADKQPTEDQSSEGASSVSTRQPESAIFLSIGKDEHRFEDLSVMNIEIAQRILEAKKQKLAPNNGETSEDSSPDEEPGTASMDDFL